MARKTDERSTYAIKFNNEVITVRTSKECNALATAAFKFGVSTTNLRKNGEVAYVIAGQELNFSKFW
jgi:hypothetical protein